MLARAPGLDEPQRVQRRSEAEAELRAALEIGDAFLQRSTSPDPLVLLQSVATRTALAQLLADTDRAGEARTEAAAVVLTLRRLAAERESARGRPLLQNSRPLDAIEVVLERIWAADLVTELGSLREDLLPRDGPGREPPPAPRRR